MKKILAILILFVINLMAIDYNGKVIGTVKIKIDSWTEPNKVFNVYCINGLQYMGEINDMRNSFLTPVYEKNGNIKTCK